MIIYVDFVNKEIVKDIPELLLNDMWKYPDTEQLREQILSVQMAKFHMKNRRGLRIE